MFGMPVQYEGFLALTFITATLGLIAMGLVGHLLGFHAYLGESGLPCCRMHDH